MRDDPLVGRTSEMRTARRVFEPAGRPALIVTGPAGIGKTRILAEIAEHEVPSGWAVESAMATPSTSTLALGAFSHFELEDLPPAMDPSARFARVALAIRDRVGDRGLLLIVDDAPLLDDASMALVHQLLVRGHAKVALSARTDAPLPEELAALVKDGYAEQLVLGPLTADDSDVLVAQILDGQVDGEVAAAIWRVAQGNPLFTQELAMWGRETNALTWTAARSWVLAGKLEVSPLLHDQMCRRLGRLEPRERDVIEALAVAERLPLAVLERIAPLEVIADLERDHLVRVDNDGDLLAQLTHPLYAAAARSAAGVARIHASCRRVADALADLERVEPTDILLTARLRLEGGPPDPDLFEAAAKAALGRYDAAQALNFAAAAEDAGGGPETTLLYARALSAVGRTDDANAAYARLAIEADEPSWLATVTHHHAWHLMAGGRLSEAAALSAERLDQFPTKEQTRLRSLLSTILFFAGRHEEAIMTAAPLEADHGDRGAVSSWTGLGAIWAIMGDPQQVVEMCDEYFESLGTSGWRDDGTVNDVECLFVRLIALWQLGRAKEGDDPFAPLSGIDGIPYVHTPEHQLGVRAPQAFFRGHLDEAAALYRRIIERLWAISVQVGCANASIYATIEAMRGEVERASACLAEVDATPLTARAGFRWWTERARAWTLVAKGDIRAGIDALRQLCDEHPAELFHVTTGLHDVVRLERPDLVADRLVAQATRDGATWWDRICSDHGDALIAGDSERLLNVATRFEAGGLDLHAAETIAQAARLLHRNGSRLRASITSMHLTDVLDRCGNARTPALLQVPALLTARELEVVRLAAAGLTNSQIASRLGTSPRTVGNQLQAAYDKLYVHDRRDLTALLEPSTG